MKGQMARGYAIAAGAALVLWVCVGHAAEPPLTRYVGKTFWVDSAQGKINALPFCPSNKSPLDCEQLAANHSFKIESFVPFDEDTTDSGDFLVTLDDGRQRYLSTVFFESGLFNKRSWQILGHQELMMHQNVFPAPPEEFLSRLRRQSRDAAVAHAKAQAKKGGVRIGMTPDQVRASTWGKPLHVNRTTTSSGTQEQWVYAGDNYLYFDNGRLSAIQNH